MREILTDLAKLSDAAKPVKLAAENGGINAAEINSIVSDLTEVLNSSGDYKALAAPQIGIDVRIVCIKFSDGIKTFINPVITKKLSYSLTPETCLSMPGKEILLARPEEITVVYYNDKLKYEENKLVGAAAKLMDQAYQFLDGTTPADIGLVSDVKSDGPLSDLTEEEFKQVAELYKKFVKAKADALEKAIKEDPELAKTYRTLKFTESVITGHAAVVVDDPKDNPEYKKSQAKIALAAKGAQSKNKAYNKAQIVKAAGKQKGIKRKAKEK